jgi:hypothetical protein
MCRMYNDYGSLARDREEGNLSCADFLLEDSDSADKTEMGLKRAQASDRQEGRDVSTKRQKIGAENGTGKVTIENDISLEDTLIKEKLMSLAQFERQCMELALTRLENTGLKGNKLEALLLFIDVTDMFGQIYVVKDIGTRTV